MDTWMIALILISLLVLSTLFDKPRANLQTAWVATSSEPLRIMEIETDGPEKPRRTHLVNANISIFYICAETEEPNGIETIAFLQTRRRGAYTITFRNGKVIGWMRNLTRLNPDRSTQELYLANQILAAAREASKVQVASS